MVKNMNNIKLRQITNMLTYDKDLSDEEKKHLTIFFTSKNYSTEDVFKFSLLNKEKKQEFLSMIGFIKQNAQIKASKGKVKIFKKNAAFISEMQLSFLTGLSLGFIIVCLLNLILLFN